MYVWHMLCMCVDDILYVCVDDVVCSLVFYVICSITVSVCYSFAGLFSRFHIFNGNRSADIVTLDEDQIYARPPDTRSPARVGLLFTCWLSYSMTCLTCRLSPSLICFTCGLSLSL